MLEALQFSWEDLAKNAVWKNIFFESNFLIPAFEHLNDGNARVLVVESTDKTCSNGQPLLCGLLPMTIKRIYGVPVSTLEIWKHDQCFDTTPLLREDYGTETLTHALEFLAREHVGLLSLDTVCAEPAFEDALSQSLRSLGLSRFQRDRIARPAFRPAESPEDYSARHVSKSLRKKVRRESRRLAKHGEVTFEVSGPEADYQQLADKFLEIERSGWKGEEGTALACDPTSEAFFKSMVARSASLGKARFSSLCLNGVPIAMMVDLASDGVLASYKTAFDNAYAQYSPGMNLEVQNVGLKHKGIEFADSCTLPDNSLINRIWGQQVQFQSVVISLRKGGPSTWVTKLMPMIQGVAKRVRKFLQRK